MIALGKKKKKKQEENKDTKPKIEYGCQQVLLSSKGELPHILEFICSEANKLTNCGIYLGRQLWFKVHAYLTKYRLDAEYKGHPHFRSLYSQAAQQTLHTVFESFKSFYELDKKYRDGELTDRPKVPHYRKKGGLAPVTYPRQNLRLTNEGEIRIPLGKSVKAWFDLQYFYIPMPSNIRFESIKEIRFLPRNQCFYAEFVYEMPKAPECKLDSNKVLGIDHGINNWLSCVSNVGTSFIVDGRKLKSLNQWYNKRVSCLKEGKPQGYWDEKLAHITEKRNRQMRDAINKTARLVVDHCIKHGIGTVVFGWNKEQKQEVKLGKTTQTFVQIPTARLKERIEQLCSYYGIQFVETEESYTSKASFLDEDFLPTYGEKPETWKASGRRIKRGMYRTGKGISINADLNGAANILRKVETQLGISLAKVSRQVLTLATRLCIWETKKKTFRGVVLTHQEKDELFESPFFKSGERSNVG